ncbi:MAG: efflux RND transporter permease subunit [Melioribacteraceae bacterium]
MKKLFYIFLTRPVTTLMFLFGVLCVGIVSILNLPIELSPHVDYPRLSISIYWQGASPEAVEAYVTSPVEAELSTIMGVKKISSKSSEGLSNIFIDFHPNTDINFARIEINEKLSALKHQLPFGISKPVISSYVPEQLENLQGFLVYSISSDKSANEIRKFIIDNVLMQLKSIDGVSNVEVRGGSDKIINIIVDYDKLKALEITNEDITNAVKDAEVIISAGKVNNQNYQYYINVRNEIHNLEIIKNQVVKKLPNNQTIRIENIAKVSEDFKEPQSYYRINGKETVNLIISKELGANTFKVSYDVKKKFQELSKIFPPDYIIIKELDKSEEMYTELLSLYRNGILSFLILFIVLLLIFRNYKYPLIIIVSIFFSLSFSFALFYLLRLTLNIITIICFIIGLGFIVDNSIVVLDYLDKHYNGRGIKYLTVYIKEIFNPLLVSTIIVISVFIPLIFLTGELKLYFKHFAIGMGSNLFASLIVSITVVPFLYLKTYKPHKKIELFTSSLDFIYKQYRKIVRMIIRFRKLSLALLILIIGLPVWLIPDRIETPFISKVYNLIFDSEFYQEIKPFLNYALGGCLNLYFNHISKGEIWSYGEETYIYVRLELPNSNRIERINKLSKDLENDILQYKSNFKNLIANVIDEENAVIRIEFDKNQANTSFPYALKNYITAYTAQLGGVNSYVYGFGPGFSNAEGISYSPFNVVVKGYNYEKVKSLAEEFRKKIIVNPRVDNVDIDKSEILWSPGTYEIIGEVDREKLKAYNISLAEIFSIITKNIGGIFNDNKFKIENNRVEYQIKFSNYNEVQLEELKNIILKDYSGKSFKVKDIINFYERKILSTINREDQQYVRYISFEFKGPYYYGKQFLQSILANIDIPPGFTIEQVDFPIVLELKNEYEILKIFLAAVVIIFMVSSSFFESFKSSLIIFSAIPFAFVGSIFVFWLFNFNMERGAYSGMLLLMGLTVNSAILMVNYILKNQQSRTIEEIINLSATRLRAILTTSSTTIFALVPFVLSSESTFWKNLSLSITGGIITSSIFIAFFIPLIYYMIVIRKKYKTI